jgi:CARDB
MPSQTGSPAINTETAKPGDNRLALPDLVIPYVTIAMQGVPVDTTECVTAYSPYELRVMIENRGNAQATNIQVYELSTRYTINISELPAGQRVEVIIPAGSPDGAYQLSVDPQNMISETNEGNNTAEYLAVTPTPPILCPSTPPAKTPSPNTSITHILWEIYRNDLHGFSFEYPMVYEEPAYIGRCGLKETETGIQLGQRIEIQYLDPGGLGLEDFASQVLQGKDWSVDSQTSQLIGGLVGINIQYRFGGTNRFGTISLVEHNNRIFGFNFSAGDFCDIQENQLQVSEGIVYAHLLESFRFDK